LSTSEYHCLVSQSLCDPFTSTIHIDCP